MGLLCVPSAALRNSGLGYSGGLCKTHRTAPHQVLGRVECPRGRFWSASLVQVTVVGSFDSESISSI